MSTRDAALATLHKVFGEAALATVSAPIATILTPDDSGVVRAPRKLRKLGKGQPLAQEAPVSFPFATKSAELVWDAAQALIPMLPLATPADILRVSMEKANIYTSDLSVEDMQMLQLAIHYQQNGPVKTNVRTGGAPGGPFNSTGSRSAP